MTKLLPQAKLIKSGAHVFQLFIILTLFHIWCYFRNILKIVNLNLNWINDLLLNYYKKETLCWKFLNHMVLRWPMMVVALKSKYRKVIKIQISRENSGVKNSKSLSVTVTKLCLNYTYTGTYDVENSVERLVTYYLCGCF